MKGKSNGRNICIYGKLLLNFIFICYLHIGFDRELFEQLLFGLLCDDVVVFLSFIHYHVINVNLCSKLLFVDILRCMHFDDVCFIYYYCMHRVYRFDKECQQEQSPDCKVHIRYLPRWFDCHWYLWSVDIFFFHLSSLPHSLLLIAILRPPDVVLCIFYTSIDEIFKANQKHLIETQDWQHELSDIGDGDGGGEGGMKSKWFSCLWFVVLKKQMHGRWIWKFVDIASTWSLHLFRFIFFSSKVCSFYCYSDYAFVRAFSEFYLRFFFSALLNNSVDVVCYSFFVCVALCFFFIFYAKVDTAACGIGDAPLSLTWAFNISHSDCIIEWLNKYLEIVISIFASFDGMA